MQGTVGQLKPLLAVGNRMDLHGSPNNASKTAFLLNQLSSNSRAHNREFSRA